MSAIREWLTAQKVVILLVVAAVVVAVLAITRQPGPEPGIGAPVAGMLTGDAERSRYRAALPYAELVVSLEVGSEAYLNGGSNPVKGPDDSRWVAVDWDVRPDANTTVAWPDADADQRVEPVSSLILMAGGKRYPLVDHLRSSNSGGEVMFAVADDEDLHLVVTSGGQTRRAGIEPSQPRAGASSPTGCREDDESARGFVARVSCSVTAQRRGYVAGLGWAPAGKEWLVVDGEASGRTSVREPSVVGEWSDTAGRHRADYVSAGKPSLALDVSNAGAPIKVARIRPAPADGDVVLASRAYLVPEQESSTVTLSYRTVAVPERGETRPPGAAQRYTVVDHARAVVEPGG